MTQILVTGYYHRGQWPRIQYLTLGGGGGGGVQVRAFSDGGEDANEANKFNHVQQFRILLPKSLFSSYKKVNKH